MPGFNVGGLGLAGQTPNTAEPRRAYRWVWTTLGNLSRPELLLLKEASRPKFGHKPVKMSHNQEQSKYVGQTEFSQSN